MKLKPRSIFVVIAGLGAALLSTTASAGYSAARFP